MPEEPIVGTDVQTALNNLEENDELENRVTKDRDYQVVINALANDEYNNITIEVLKRLLTICARDATTLKSTTTTAMRIIVIILTKIKSGKYDPAPDLLPSAVAVLNVIKTIIVINKMESLVTLAYETLLSYPDDVLIALTDHPEQIMEVLKLYCNIHIPVPTKMQAYIFLHKLLKILPPEKKQVFVKNGILIWFSKIIPMTMIDIPDHLSAVGHSDILIDVLEFLTEDLIHLDYTNNPHWHSILECICKSEQYPILMKSLLDAGITIWSRIWIVLVRLLKHQLTESLKSIGTPINSMLPVVEAAFKDAPLSRCKAFECWSVLADSFAAESNEKYIIKRIKLLLIPLKLNNAKIDTVALAKFKCWWHIIRQFQGKIDKILDPVLVSFLNFCFGRHNADKSSIVPGIMSVTVKINCNEALVDMVGHVNCEGCTNLPKLTNKLINTKHLVDNWNHWIYSLTSVIMRTANNSNGLSKQQLTCLWKSFLMTIGELPENNIRKDLFSEILSIIAHLLKECHTNSQFLGIAFNILIMSLFEEKEIKNLFKSTTNDSNEPIFRIVNILLDSSLHEFYKGVPTEELATKFKTFTTLIVDDTVCNTKVIFGKLLSILPENDYGLLLWNAIAESLRESPYYKYGNMTHNILLWPLKSMRHFKEVKIPGLTWYMTYDLMKPKSNVTNQEISEVLISSSDDGNLYFQLCVVLGLLKHKIVENNCADCEKEINLLLTITKGIDCYENFEKIFPIMIDRVVAIMSVATSSINDTVTALILVCVKNILHVLTKACKQQTDVSHLMIFIANLLRPLEKLFEVESYSKLIPAMTYHLLKCSTLLSAHLTTKTILVSLMKTILLKTDRSDTNYSKIETVISDAENSVKFTTPQITDISKRTKKKGANIVSTIVENGEEYVVVKSNWKFNPKKLTEAQKEKLQRKREDIPALYQDLSQSQEDFKLTTWKTDSQDTTSSSKSESKSNKVDTNVSTTEILKNLPSSNVVPKILENFFAEKKNSEGSVSIANINAGVSSPSTKNTKSPRMALKDRIFKNVRNLIESSGLQKENKDSLENSNKIDNILKTPPHTKNDNYINVINSAPPLLSADRPSRVKRKPKKFEDLMLTTKKRRNSLHDLQDNTQPSVNDDPSTCNSEPTGDRNIAEENNKLSNAPDETVLQTTENTRNLQVDLDDKINIEELSKNNDIASDENNSTKKDDNSLKDSVTGLNNEVQDVEFRTLGDSKLAKDNSSSKDAEEIFSTIKSTTNMDTSNNKISTNISKDAKEVLTPKRVKVLNKITTPKTKTEIEASISSKDIKEVSATKSTRVEVSIARLTETNNENSASTSIIAKDIRTPKRTKRLKEIVARSIVTTPETAEADREYSEHSSKTVKEMVTPKRFNFKETSASSIPEEVADNTNSTSVRSLRKNLSDMCKDVPTPKGSKFSKKNPSRNSPKDVTEVSILETPEDNQKIVNIKESHVDDLTPSVICIDVQSKSSTSSTNIVTPSNVEKVMASPKASTEPKDLTSETPKLGKDSNLTKDIKEISPLKLATESKKVTTPKCSPKGDEQKSTTKKSTAKKSRIEKELAIDTVEGNPYLKVQSSKRLTRKTLEESANIGRRKGLVEKLNKSKSEGSSLGLKGDKKSKDKTKGVASSNTIVDESQEKDSDLKEQTTFSEELPYSDDIIESSQDSSVTSISVKSTRNTSKKVPLVCVQKIIVPDKVTNISQSILDCGAHKTPAVNYEVKDDSVLPLNKTAVQEETTDELTENMDTEPLKDNDLSEDVIAINDSVPSFTVATNDSVMGPESQEIAEADTQLTDPKDFIDVKEVQDNLAHAGQPAKVNDATETTDSEVQNVSKKKSLSPKSINVNSTANNSTLTLECVDLEQSIGPSSPFKDEAQRQQDFLNNTIEISPIKNMSPDRNKKSPSPETSSDYVVIKLSSPVHSNGEPFEKSGSPEVFTEDKVSPDKRDQSPPRVEVVTANTSPSSALSLKKNRPVRSGGRAAQMLGLCVPDKVQAIVKVDRIDPDEIKKSTSTNIHARRNLRIFYNSVNDAESSSSSSSSTIENDDSENFLKFRRSLPAVDSSPSGPILKRKLAEIVDDAVISPASKRKRVSFHDPPVSTTISVQKYIDPLGLRSPQNSAHKRLERQIRQQTHLKSPKRLDNMFKLDSTTENLPENDVILISDDTQSLNLTETPVVEIVRASELNDTDPICPELLDCNDPIENIAGELSSSAMKSLFIKKLEGKIETIGDLAKMTELEVNRLCIKAPKVKVAKKALTDYVALKAGKVETEIIVTLDQNEFDIPVCEAEVNSTIFDEPMAEIESTGINIETQASRTELMDIEVQTSRVIMKRVLSQTDAVQTAHTSIQTDESGSKSTADIITSCINERPDFMEELSKQLPLNVINDLLMKKITPLDTKFVLDRILKQGDSSSNNRSKQLELVKDYVCTKFDTKDLILFCSDILKLVYDKTA